MVDLVPIPSRFIQKDSASPEGEAAHTDMVAIPDHLIPKAPPPPSGQRPSAPTADIVDGQAVHLQNEPERVTTTQEHIGPDQPPAGILANVKERAARFFTNDLPGLPGNVASMLMAAPKVWADMRPEDQSKLREQYPHEQKFFDFLGRSSAKMAEEYGAQRFRKITDHLGVTEGIEPQTPGEHIAAAGTDVAAIAATMGLGAEGIASRALSQSAKLVGEIDKSAARIVAGKAGDAAVNATGGAVVGGAGEVAQHQVDNPKYKPLAEAGGQILGAVGAVGLERTAQSGIRFFNDMLTGQYSSPMRATREILDKGGPTVKTDIARAAGDRPGSPGFEPTTYQATGNQGIGTLEADARRGAGKEAFEARDVEQNRALVEGTRGLAEDAGPKHMEAIKKILGDDPDKIISLALKNPAKMDELIASIQDKPKSTTYARIQALQKTVIDYLTKTGNVFKAGVKGGDVDTPVFSAKAFQTLVDNNSESLSKVFTPEQMKNFGVVLGEAKQTMMRGSASANPGQPLIRKALWMASIVGGGIGALVHKGIGGYLMGKAAGVLGEQAVESSVAKRAANMKEALVDILLNPKLANSLMEKIPERATPEQVNELIGRRIRDAVSSDVLENQDK